MRTQIEEMFDANEEEIWQGKPDRVAYLVSSALDALLFVLAACCGIMALWFACFGRSTFGVGRMIKNQATITMILPTMIIVYVVLYCLVMVYTFFYHKTISYAFTDKRVFKRAGVFREANSAVDYTAVENVHVTVSILQRIFNCGTVHFAGNSGIALQSIKNPYEVFKKLKGVAYDIKTDIHYPNELRPEENEGYKTKYTNR